MSAAADAKRAPVAASVFSKKPPRMRGKRIRFADKMAGGHPDVTAGVAETIGASEPEQDSHRVLNYRNAQAVAEWTWNWCKDRYGEEAAKTVAILDLNTRSGLVSNALAETGFENVFHSPAPSDATAFRSDMFLAQHLTSTITPQIQRELLAHNGTALIRASGYYHMLDTFELEALEQALDPHLNAEADIKRAWPLMPFDMTTFVDACRFRARPSDAIKRQLHAVRLAYKLGATTEEAPLPPTTPSQNALFSYGYVQDTLQRLHMLLPQKEGNSKLEYVHARNVVMTVLSRMLETTWSQDRVSDAVISYIAEAALNADDVSVRYAPRKRMAVGEINCLSSFYASSASGAPSYVAPQVVIVNSDWNCSYQEWLLFLVNLRSLAENAPSEVCYIFWEPLVRSFSGLFPLASMALTSSGSEKERRCKQRLLAARQWLETGAAVSEKQEEENDAENPQTGDAFRAGPPKEKEQTRESGRRERMLKQCEDDGTYALLQQLGGEVEEPWLKRLDQILLRRTPLPAAVKDPYLRDRAMPAQPAPNGSTFQTKTFDLMEQKSGPLRFFFYTVSDTKGSGTRPLPMRHDSIKAQFSNTVSWLAKGADRSPMFLERVYDDHKEIRSRWTRFMSILPSQYEEFQFSPEAVGTASHMQLEAHPLPDGTATQDIIFNAPKRIYSVGSGKGLVAVDIIPPFDHILLEQEHGHRFRSDLRNRLLFDTQKEGEWPFARIRATGMFAVETAMLEVWRLVLLKQSTGSKSDAEISEASLFAAAVVLLSNQLVFARTNRVSLGAVKGHGRSIPKKSAKASVYKTIRQSWVKDLNQARKVFTEYAQLRSKPNLKPTELPIKFRSVTDALMAISDHADEEFVGLYYEETKAKDEQFLNLETSLFLFSSLIAASGQLNPLSTEGLSKVTQTALERLAKEPEVDEKAISGIYGGGMAVPADYAGNYSFSDPYDAGAGTLLASIMRSSRTKTYGLPAADIKIEEDLLRSAMREFGDDAVISHALRPALSYRNALSVARCSRSLLEAIRSNWTVRTAAQSGDWKPKIAIVGPLMSYVLRAYRATMPPGSVHAAFFPSETTALEEFMMGSDTSVQTLPKGASLANWLAGTQKKKGDAKQQTASGPFDYVHIGLDWSDRDPDLEIRYVMYPELQRVLGFLSNVFASKRLKQSGRAMLVSFVVPKRRTDVNNHGFETHYDPEVRRWVPRESDFTAYVDTLLQHLTNEIKSGPMRGTGYTRACRVFWVPIGPLAVVYLLLNSPLDDRQFEYVIPAAVRNAKLQPHEPLPGPKYEPTPSRLAAPVYDAKTRTALDRTISSRAGRPTTRGFDSINLLKHAGTGAKLLETKSTALAQMADTALRTYTTSHTPAVNHRVTAFIDLFRTGVVTASAMEATRDVLLDEKSGIPAVVRQDLQAAKNMQQLAAEIRAREIRQRIDEHIRSKQGSEAVFSRYLEDSKSAPDPDITRAALELATAQLAKQEEAERKSGVQSTIEGTGPDGYTAPVQVSRDANAFNPFAIPNAAGVPVPWKRPTGDDSKSSGPRQDEESKQLWSELNATIIKSPGVLWQDVIGQEEILSEIETVVREPLDNPNSDVKWTGILLYGPPGTGKSLTAKAIATSASTSKAPAKFMSLSSAELSGRYHGESEKRIRTAFAVARANKPVVMFIDEIDSILGRRKGTDDAVTSKVKTQFLIEMEGVGKDRTGVLVVAATNNPWALDEALMSRLPEKYYIGLPDTASRAKILHKLLSEYKGTVKRNDIDPLALRAQGMSGREIRSVVEKAVKRAATRRRKAGGAPDSGLITTADLQTALATTGHAVTEADITRYGQWASDHGMDTADIERDLLQFHPSQSSAAAQPL